MRYRALIIAFLAMCLGLLAACGETPDLAERESLTYNQVRNTGLAVNCPLFEGAGRGSISLEPGQSYQITELCLQPTDYFVKEEAANKRQKAEYIAGKLLTRYTYTIDQVSGDLNLSPDGLLTFAEKAGMDFQAITVQLPGGEQIPFFFTIKQLVATAQSTGVIDTSTDFSGEFNVPSYRSAGFLDPKGRGEATGYDNAVALPAGADAEDLATANVKRTPVRRGEISLQISKIDGETGEIAGTFESEQPSATDLGAHESHEVKVLGVFYARVEPA